MTTQPIRVKLDVTKIDKSALFKGAKGTYLDVTLWPTPDSQYGDDYRATQDIGKERREAGEKGPILGNAKIMPAQTGGGQRQAAPPPQKPQEDADDQDCVPF